MLPADTHPYHPYHPYHLYHVLCHLCRLALLGVLLAACNSSSPGTPIDSTADSPRKDSRSDSSNARREASTARDTATDRRSLDGPARTDIPAACTPILHKTDGFQSDLSLQRYRFVGGSADGKKVAVVFSHFGASSGAPFVNVWGYQTGSSTPLFHQSGFLMSGGETELSQLEASVLAAAAGSMASAGIIVGQHLPQPTSWCQQAGGALLVDPGITLATVAVNAPCPADPAKTTSELKVCTKATPPVCAATAEADTTCPPQPATLVDLYRNGSTWWVVAQKRLEPLTGLFFSVRSVVGAVFP